MHLTQELIIYVFTQELIQYVLNSKNQAVSHFLKEN